MELETAHKSLNGPMSGGRAWVLSLSGQHSELEATSIFRQRPNIPGTRIVLSVPLCVRASRDLATCDTPVESNFHAAHMSYQAFMSQPRLVDIRRRLLYLPTALSGQEVFVVEVY